jgi:predicted DNA-binding protein
MSKLIRISNVAAEKLESLSNLSGKPKQKIIEEAVIRYAHEQILKKANEQYAAIKKDPKIWQEMQNELNAWDVSVIDGLDNDDKR